MNRLDWATLLLFFAMLVLVGCWSFLRIKKTDDFYVAGGGAFHGGYQEYRTMFQAILVLYLQAMQLLLMLLALRCIFGGRLLLRFRVF